MLEQLHKSNLLTSIAVQHDTTNRFRSHVLIAEPSEGYSEVVHQFSVPVDYRSIPSKKLNRLGWNGRFNGWTNK